jgi:hypothetical protein
MTKADQTAADRLLKAACRRAVELYRGDRGDEAQAVLSAAEVAAACLLDEVAV